MEFNNPSKIIKDIATGSDARIALKRGIDQLADAVKITLGASGRTVIYQDATGRPCVTKDGVTVAETVVLWDPVEDMGATMVREAASNTVKEAGDGTTTATVLAQAMITEFNKLVERKLTNAEIIRGVNGGLTKVLEYLDDVLLEVTDDMLRHVATISCNNDPELGALVAGAYNESGTSGAVLLEDSSDAETFVEVSQGVQIPSGYKSSYWVTNKDYATAELDNPMVLILTSPLANLRKIQNILEMVVKKKRSILIVGEVEQHALATLLANKVKGVLDVCVIDLPGFGPTKQDSVEDLAVMTGATPVSEELGDDIDFIGLEHLGEAQMAVIDTKKTVLQVEVDAEGLKPRIDSVKKKIEETDNPFLKKKLEDRLGLLAGTVAVIKVGAETKLELKEKKDRLEDAVYAVKAAIKEGIVPGGGVALFNAAAKVLTDENPGEAALRRAILAPFFTILENSDTVLAQPVIKELEGKTGHGVDVVTGEIVDMVKHGIIDPVLVTKTALKNAVSVSTTIISAGAVLSNKIQM